MPNCDAVFIGNTRWCKWQAAQDESLRPEEVPRTILTPFHRIIEPIYKKGCPRDRVFSYMAWVALPSSISTIRALRDLSVLSRTTAYSVRGTVMETTQLCTPSLLDMEPVSSAGSFP